MKYISIILMSLFLVGNANGFQAFVYSYVETLVYKNFTKAPIKNIMTFDNLDSCITWMKEMEEIEKEEEPKTAIKLDRDNNMYLEVPVKNIAMGYGHCLKTKLWVNEEGYGQQNSN